MVLYQYLYRCSLLKNVLLCVLEEQNVFFFERAKSHASEVLSSGCLNFFADFIIYHRLAEVSCLNALYGH